MTAYTWIGGTGDWRVASNWSPSGSAGPPTATDTATISATGTAYTVTIDTADVAKSLTENSSSATVDDAGSLTLGRTFTLSAGTFILGQGGTLSGGTAKLRGGAFVCEGGTLSGVTYDGALDLSAKNASVNLARTSERAGVTRISYVTQLTQKSGGSATAGCTGCRHDSHDVGP
jgi:hypothetical protein